GRHGAVGGDRDGEHLVAGRGYAGQEAVQLGRLGGGAHGGDRVVAAVGGAVAGAAGADRPGGHAELEQRAGDRGGHGGLAVGPGHPDGGEALGGAAVDQRGRERGGGTRIVDDQRGQSRRLAALPAGRVGEGHGGAAAGGLGGELRAVGGGTGQGAPEIAGFDGAGIEAHAPQGEILLGGRGAEGAGQRRRRRAVRAARAG